MRTPRVCVVGSSITDLVAYAARLPRLGETLPGDDFAVNFGGKGANQAAMAAKLGAEVAMVSKLGDDAFGRDYLANFAALGIDARHVTVTADAPTGVAPIWVDRTSGDNQILVVLGANELLGPADVAAAADVIGAADVLVCQWECPLPAVIAAMTAARADAVRTVFNPAPVRGELPDELYAVCDVLCPNETEVEALTGITARTIDDAVAGARVLLDRGVRDVVVTLGERGSVWVDAAHAEHVPAPSVRPVDTTGAGDAFIGSLAVFLAAGHPMREAMERANRIAAISVQRPGAQRSFPDATELPADLLDPPGDRAADGDEPEAGFEPAT